MRSGAWLGLVACLAAAWPPSGAAGAPVVVVEDASADSAYDVFVRTSFVKRALSRAGLAYEARPDAVLETGALDGQALAVLPANPSLGPGAAETLRRFVAGGGRLVVFPPAPELLRGLIGVDSVDRPASARDDRLSSLVFDQAALEALPSTWHQLDWTYQGFEPGPEARLLGVWAGDDQGLNGRAAAVMTRYGAFVGGAPQGDDRQAEAQLLLAVACYLRPDLWRRAVPGILHQVGAVGDAASLREVRRRVEAPGLAPDRRELAWRALSSAILKAQQGRRGYESAVAQSTLPAGRSPTATPTARYLPAALLGWEAQVAAEQAYYLAQTSRPNEFRGVWMQQAGDLRQWGWQRIVAALRENNVDALFYNAANAGYANYPSRILPHVTVEGDDPLAEVVHWCRELGVQCHVWLMCNYLRPLTPAAFFAELADDGRLQRTGGGQTLNWLRPSDPRNRDQVARVAREIVERYDIDGLHLDYIRYSPDGDYGEPERAAFEDWLGSPVANWPDDTALGQPLRTRWVDFRVAQVNEQVRAVVEAVRAVRPAVRVSAAVYPIWTDARFRVGQDPEAWAAAGWVDFLCPMNYHTNDTTFFRYLTVQQRAVGSSVPLYPGIAAWRQESPAETIAQILRLRNMSMSGYVLFHLDRRMVREWLPALRLGVAAAPAALGPATGMAFAGGAVATARDGDPAVRSRP